MQCPTFRRIVVPLCPQTSSSREVQKPDHEDSTILRNRQQPDTQRHGVTTQNNWIFIIAAVLTLNLAFSTVSSTSPSATRKERGLWLLYGSNSCDLDSFTSKQLGFGKLCKGWWVSITFIVEMLVAAAFLVVSPSGLEGQFEIKRLLPSSGTIRTGWSHGEQV